MGPLSSPRLRPSGQIRHADRRLRLHHLAPHLFRLELIQPRTEVVKDRLVFGDLRDDSSHFRCCGGSIAPGSGPSCQSNSHWYWDKCGWKHRQYTMACAPKRHSAKRHEPLCLPDGFPSRLRGEDPQAKPWHASAKASRPTKQMSLCGCILCAAGDWRRRAAHAVYFRLIVAQVRGLGDQSVTYLTAPRCCPTFLTGFRCQL